MFSISWKDIPERYDSPKIMESYSLKPDLLFKSGNLLQSDVLIKGDNYPVLYNLKKYLSSSFNVIYIDPPYNTGNDFTYNDDFSGTEGKHDAWLSFMLAKELLVGDGVIFIAIDQSELYVLKLLCDSIFGENNFVNDFMWLHGKGKKDKWARTLQQHTLCYGKNKKSLKPFKETIQTSWATKNMDNDKRGNWFSGSISFSEIRSNPCHKNFYTITSPSGKSWSRQWQVSHEEMDRLIKEDRIYWGAAPDYQGVPRKKVFYNDREEVIPRNIIDNVETTREAQKYLDKILGVSGIFDNPKPVGLITHLLEITNMPSDAVILDFFAGSGTTFEAVCKLNKIDNGTRKVVLVQNDEPCNVGNIYLDKNKDIPFNTIYEICEKRCKKVSEMYNESISFCTLVPENK